MVLSGRKWLYCYFSLSTVPAAKLSVAPQAKETFAMTKLHKDVAVRLIQCTEDEEFTDQATIKVHYSFETFSK
jgi:FKBP-type peptidyl-prolyl cis-trans isomerase